MDRQKKRKIFLYDTLMQEKIEFLPLYDGKIGMYVCGVTVYDLCHIGHARSLFVFSLLNRVLKRCGYDVLFVRNITDIDDKIINKLWKRNSAKQISLTELRDFVDEYIGYYYEDISSLGLFKADVEPRATEYIPQMIDFVKRLIDIGYAYVTSSGNVYYSVERFSDYGKLSKRNIKELLSGTRKDVEVDKRSPLDFALWKARKENEPFWESPWGEGRPGWHLECAVMSTDIIGGTLDIHGGGLDLIFPHHENEIAEAEPILGKEFARYWVHNGMVLVNREKMSKSLGNFITIRSALKKYPAYLLRLWFLTTHYRSPIDFSDEKMKEMEKIWSRITSWFRLLYQRSKQNDFDEGLSSFGHGLRETFWDSILDDLNTPKALASLFDTISKTMPLLKDGRGDKLLLEVAEEVLDTLFLLQDIELDFVEQVGLDDDMINLILEARAVLRKHKEFGISDRIRDALDKRGILIEDTKDGSRWMRK